MAGVLDELVRYVAVRRAVAAGRRRRACCAWMSLAAAVRWRKVKVLIACWQAWRAHAVRCRAAASHARAQAVRGRIRRAFASWKDAYLQVRCAYVAVLVYLCVCVCGCHAPAAGLCLLAPTMPVPAAVVRICSMHGRWGAAGFGPAAGV